MNSRMPDQTLDTSKPCDRDRFLQAMRLPVNTTLHWHPDPHFRQEIQRRMLSLRKQPVVRASLPGQQ